MAKEKDLQKAIEEIRSSLQDKDLDALKDQLFSKINTNGGNITDILNDNSLQNTLQSLLNNKNISSLLQNPEITNQLSSLLKTNKTKDLIDQVQNILDSNSEKKN